MAIQSTQSNLAYEDSLGYDDLLNIVGGTSSASAPAQALPWESLAQQILQQWQSYGIAPEVKGINRANELAQILSNYGISDLSKLGIRETPYEEMRGNWQGGESGEYVESLYKGNRGQLTYGDQTFGRLGGFGSGGEREFSAPQEYLTEAGDGRYGLGYSAAGKGWTDYEIVTGRDGKPVIVPKWGSSSDLTPELVQFLAVAAAPFTGGLSTALANAGLGAVGGQIASQALISGAFTGAGNVAQGTGSFGSGFGKGALTGAVAAGLGQFASPFAKDIGKYVLESTGNNQLLADIASGAVRGAATAAPSALASGNLSDILGGAVSGGAGGGFKNFTDSLFASDRLPEKITGIQSVDNAIFDGINRLAGSAVQAALTGQDIDFEKTLLPSVAMGFADQYKIPVGQVMVGLQTASKLLQGQDLSASDLYRLGSAFSGQPTSQTPTSRSAALQEPGAGYGGADFGFFDPAAEASLLRGMSPMDMASFLEANVDDPATIDQLMQQYFPELYAQVDQRIPITAQKQQDEGVIIPDWDISSSTVQRVPVTGTRLQDPQLEFPGQFVDEPKILPDPNQRIDVTGSLLQGPVVDLPPTNVDPPRIINVKEGDVQQVEIVGGGTGGPRTIVDVPDVTKIKPDEILDGTKIVEPDLAKDLPGGIVATPTTPATKPATKPAAETPAGTTTETVTRTPGQPTVHTPIMANVSPFDINSLVMQLADRGMTTDDLIQILRG